MRATLDRLLIPANLRRIRRLAQKQVPINQASHGADDLVQAALAEMVTVLPTERGALAETAWVLFCERVFADAWRKIFGKDGVRLTLKIGDERVPITYAKPDPDGVGGSNEGRDTKEMPEDPVEVTDGSAAPWHAGVKKSDLPIVERIIEETISALPDAVMRHVAEDQWGEDPSPVSSGTSKGGKPPLTERTGLSRHQLARMLRNLRSRLAGALLAEEKITVDTEWLRQFVHGERSRTRNKPRQQAR
jgi:hypothetical protein